jgi:hypothetical protein
MACTNRSSGWPGCRWGRGPDWTTTGVIRPVTEIKRSVPIAVDDLSGLRANQMFFDAAFANQPARAPVRCGATVVDLARWEPAIRYRQDAAEPGGLVGQLWLDPTHCGIRAGSAKRPQAHAAFHGLQIEGFDHDVAIAARQLRGELVGGFLS